MHDLRVLLFYDLWQWVRGTSLRGSTKAVLMEYGGCFCLDLVSYGSAAVKWWSLSTDKKNRGAEPAWP